MRYEQSIAMLNHRMTEAATDPQAVPDVAEGIRAMIQKEISRAGMAAGRQQHLMDLQKKTTEAESTHDPIIVQNLITALTAFLTEELNEASGEDDDNDAEGGDGTPDDLTPPEDSVDAGDNGDGDVVDSGGENLTTTTDAAAPPSKPAGKSKPAFLAKKESDCADGMKEDSGGGFGETMDMEDSGGGFGESMSYECEACGHKGAMNMSESSRAANGEAKGDRMKEAQANSATPGSVDASALAQQIEADRAKIATLENEVKSLREAAKPLVGASTSMTEADRQELARLRINERQRELASKAAEAIGEYAKENGVPDSFMRECVKVEDLTAFAESQWPTILGALGRNVEVPREWGATEPAMPAPKRSATKRESGADYLRSMYGGSVIGGDK